MVVEPVFEEIHYIGIDLDFPSVKLVFCLNHLFDECPVNFHVIRSFGVAVAVEYFLFLFEMFVGIIEQPAENIPYDFQRLVRWLKIFLSSSKIALVAEVITLSQWTISSLPLIASVVKISPDLSIIMPSRPSFLRIFRPFSGPRTNIPVGKPSGAFFAITLTLWHS